MTWASYLTYLAFAAVVVVAPGQDFALVVRNTVAGGRRAGRFTALGVASSNTVQGTAAALGLGAVIVHSQPVFNAIRWIGAAYLVYLGAQALWSAWRGKYAVDASTADPADDGRPWLRWRQGFLSNITNPKVLALYISVLPQFLHDGRASTANALTLAYTHAVLSLIWLIVLVAVLHRVRRWIGRRRVRRTLDAATGTVLVGFGARLATNH